MLAAQAKAGLSSNVPVYKMEDLVKEIVCLCSKIEELEERPAVATPLSVKPSKVKLDKPEPYDGTKGALCGFLTKLRAHFLHYEDDFGYEFTKVIFASNRLTGNALEWFEPTLRDYLDHADTPEQREDETKKIFGKYEEFETAIKEAFGDPNEERNSE